MRNLLPGAARLIAPAVAISFAMALAPAMAAAPAKTTPQNPAWQMPNPAKDDPAKVAAAKQFLYLFHPRTDPKDILERVNKMVPRFAAAAKKRDPKLDVKKYEKEMRDRILTNSAKIVDRQAHVVSRYFTLPELKRLIAFNSSPIGRKLSAVTPKIQMELRRESRVLRQKAMAERDKKEDAEDKAAKAKTAGKAKSELLNATGQMKKK